MDGSVGADRRRIGEPLQEQVEVVGESVGEPGQAGAEHLQVDPRAAAAHPELEAVTGDRGQERGLLGERDRVAGGQDRGGGADGDPPGAAQDMGGERDRRRAGPVGQKVVLGEPDAVEPRFLGRDGVLDGVAQSAAVRIVGVGPVLLAGTVLLSEEGPGEEEQVDRRRFSSHATRGTGSVAGRGPR